MNKVLRISIIGLPVFFVLFGFALLISMAGKRQVPKPAPVKKGITQVDIIKLVPQKVRIDIISQGTVRAAQKAIITSPISGLVTYISPNFNIGQFVPGPEDKKDSILIKLDPQPFIIRVNRAKASLQSAQAKLNELQKSESYLKRQISIIKKQVNLTIKEYNRLEGLGKKNVTAAKTLESAEEMVLNHKKRYLDAKQQLIILPTQKVQANALVKQAKADLQMAERDLRYTIIRTPFAAQVVTKNVEVGDYIQTGTTLAKLSGSNSYEIPVNIQATELEKLTSVPSSALPKVARYKEVIGSPEAEIRWLAFNDFQWKGNVVRLEPMDMKTRTFPIIVEIKNPWKAMAKRTGMPLMIGSFCEVRIKGREQKWMKIPIKALRKEDTIYILKEGKLIIEKVRVLQREKEHAIIAPIGKIQDYAIIYTVDESKSAEYQREMTQKIAQEFAILTNIKDLKTQFFGVGLFFSFNFKNKIPKEKEKEIHAKMRKQAELFAKKYNVTLAMARKKGYFPTFGYQAQIITSQIQYPIPGMPLKIRKIKTEKGVSK